MQLFSVCLKSCTMVAPRPQVGYWGKKGRYFAIFNWTSVHPKVLTYKSRGGLSLSVQPTI